LTVELWSREYEGGLIASLVENEDMIDQVAGMLNPEDFHFPDTRKLFRIINSRYLKEGQLSKIEVMMEKEWQENSEEYLNNYITVVDLEFAAKKIKDFKRKRQAKRALIESYKILERQDEVENLFTDIQDKIYQATTLNEHNLIYDVEEICIETMEKMMERRENSRSPKVKTNFGGLDYMLNGGLDRGHLSILAGRPSMGKTALATCLTGRMLASDTATLLISLEMTRDKLVDRLIIERSKVAATNYYDVGEDALTEDEADKIELARSYLHDKPLKIVDRRGLNIDDIKSIIRKANTLFENKLRMVIIDYLAVISIASNTSRTDKEYANAASELRNLAGELDIHILLLHQINRELKNRKCKRPQLTDLRDTGQLEEIADNVIFVHRPEYYTAKEEGRDEELIQTDAEIYVAKQREGRTGPVPAIWYPEILYFQDSHENLRFGDIGYFGGQGGISHGEIKGQGNEIRARAGQTNPEVRRKLPDMD